MVVRSGKDDGDRGADVVCVEIWEGGALAAEMIVFPKTHGAVCVDGTFGGISWSAAEGRVAYVAEAPAPDPTPEWPSDPAAVDGSGGDGERPRRRRRRTTRGKGLWTRAWGEQLVGRVEPAVFGRPRHRGRPRDESRGARRARRRRVLGAPTAQEPRCPTRRCPRSWCGPNRRTSTTLAQARAGVLLQPAVRGVPGARPSGSDGEHKVPSGASH